MRDHKASKSSLNLVPKLIKLSFLVIGVAFLAQLVSVAFAGIPHTMVGNLSVSNNLSVQNMAYFDNKIGVGNQSPQAMVDIAGNVSLGSNVSVSRLLQVGGNGNGGVLTFGNGETIDNLVNGRITIDANLSVVGNFVSAGTITTSDAQAGASKGVYDFAEAIDGKDFEDGDVIVIGYNYTFERSTTGYDPNVVGVISDTHAVLAGPVDYVTRFPLSMAGIVYVKVTGEVKRGQLLVSSDQQAGCAMASSEYRVGTVIGKALEDRQADDLEKTKIRMLVMNI
jgi:hypothetical protein